MQVTIVANDVGNIGGMELVLAELVRGLAAAGDEVTVVARTADVPGARFEFHRVRGPSRPFVIAYPWFLLAASVVLRRHRRGVVQATGAIVLNRVDFVAVHFCHRAFGRQPGAATASRDTLPFKAHARLARALARFGERLCMRPARIGGVIAVSPGVAAEVREMYPRLADRVTVITNGVDRKRFSPPSTDQRLNARSRLGVPAAVPLALFVGGDWGRKGLAFAINALADASEWHLAVAGRGDEAAYRRLAVTGGVAERVYLLGVMSDAPMLYHAADAFVLPTSYETFSLVTYEAAASGLPLLATAVSGIEDLLVDGVTGFCITLDSAEIALRLRQLAATPELAGQMGAEARRATADYTWDATVAHHRALYQAVRRQPGGAQRDSGADRP
jgi:glycosyltransferase involved in cell wall biosynthesis